MVSKGILFMVVAVALPFAAWGQGAPQDLPKSAPIPSDPLELVTGPIQAVDTPGVRDAMVQLLSRARKNYELGGGYDLKVSFMVTSGGATEYDGAWQMEQISDPKFGVRWSATATAGYSITELSYKQKSYAQRTAETVPLRLHEVRAALLGPLPTGAEIDHGVMRTSTANFNGAQVTCVLVSPSASGAASTAGRSWEETEDCIDPQSGLLQTHSQAPGRYYSYDYAGGAQLGAHLMPHKVTVTEGGKVVSEITVDSLTPHPGGDPSLFVPTPEMKSQGTAIALGGAQKISHFSRPGPFPPGATAQPVVVFGVVTASGQVVEAHSLQPSDPNSQAAVDEVKQMDFRRSAPAGARPVQHLVFVIEKFVSSQ